MSSEDPDPALGTRKRINSKAHRSSKPLKEDAQPKPEERSGLGQMVDELLGRTTDARNVLMANPLAKKIAKEQAAGGMFGHALRTGTDILERDTKKDEEFLKGRDALLSLEKYTFDDLRKEKQKQLSDLEDQYGGPVSKATLLFNKYAGTGEDHQLVEKSKQDCIDVIRVIDELTVHEKRNPRLLNLDAKKDIAKKLGFKTLREIYNTLTEYDLMHEKHLWLKRRQARGAYMPTFERELHWMMQGEPTKGLMKMMKREQFKRMHPLDRDRRQKKSTQRAHRPLSQDYEE